MLPDRLQCATLLLGLCSAPRLFGLEITSGFIDVPRPPLLGTFQLSGSGFDVSGNFFNIAAGWGPLCGPLTIFCSDPLSVGGGVTGIDFGAGSATIGGTFYPFLRWGDINAGGGDAFFLRGPPIPLDHGPGTYSGSFSFTGILCGTNPVVGDPSPHACVVDLRELTGAGQATITLVQDDLGVLRGSRVTYAFSSVPESSSFFLVATALLLLGVNYKRLNRRRS